MRKRGNGYVIAGAFLILLAAFVYLSPTSCDREMAFTGGLHNTLYHLDEAKSNWAEKQNKSEGQTPTMADLAPYLGEWTNSIKRFKAAGIDFKITPFSEGQRQTDVAIFTRNVSFQRGFCRFYRAGTSFGLYTGWAAPQSYSASQLVLAYYHHYRPLLGGVIFLCGIASMSVVGLRNIQSSTASERTNEDPSA